MLDLKESVAAESAAARICLGWGKGIGSGGLAGIRKSLSMRSGWCGWGGLYGR